MSQAIIRQFIKFGSVGAVSTVIDFAILNILVKFADFNVYMAGTVSFILAATNGFILNSALTFKRKKNEGDFDNQSHIRYIGYLIVSAVGLGLNLGIMFLLIEFGHIWYNFAKLAAVFIVMFWNFGANKKWVFV